MPASLLLGRNAFAQQNEDMADAPSVEDMARRYNLQFPPAQVEVSYDIAPVDYDFSRRLPELKSIATSQLARNVQDSSQPVGLAVGDLAVSTNGQHRIAQLPSGESFGALASLNVNLTIRNNIIFVAQELPQYSCPHIEVLRHEQTHKEIDRATLEEFRDKGQDFFTQVAQLIGVIHASSPAEISATIDDHIKEAAHKFDDALAQARQARQAAFDSPEEYRRLSNSCDGLTEAIVRKYVQR